MAARYRMIQRCVANLEKMASKPGAFYNTGNSETEAGDRQTQHFQIAVTRKTGKCRGKRAA